MKIGVPKEIKNNEFRVGLTPSSVAELVTFNHDIFIQSKNRNNLTKKSNQIRMLKKSLLEGENHCVLMTKPSLICGLAEHQNGL